MNEMLSQRSPVLRTTRLVKQLVLLGFIIGLITLGAFVWYLYQMKQAQNQLQTYQDHYNQIFTSFNLTMSEAQRDFQSLSHLARHEVPVASATWANPLVELAVKLVDTQAKDVNGYQKTLNQNITQMLDKRQILIENHFKIRDNYALKEQKFAELQQLLHQMDEKLNRELGVERLKHAIMIRAYLRQPGKTIDQAVAIVDHMRDMVAQPGLYLEFEELRSYLDRLHRSQDIAEIADLKDNRISSVISRIHNDPSLHTTGDSDEQFHQFEQLLYGQSFHNRMELQSFDIIPGSLFDLSRQQVILTRQRHDIHASIEQCFATLLRIQTDIALQTRVSATEVWDDFQSVGHRIFVQTSIVLSSCWALFFVVGMLIQRSIRQQIAQQVQTHQQLKDLVAQHDRDKEESQRLYQTLLQSHRLESIGQLASGIAREINTPSQYVTDNSEFLKTACQSLGTLQTHYDQLLKQARLQREMMPFVQAVESAIRELDAEFLWKEVPHAIDQTLEGIHRVSSIVTSMQQFAASGSGEKLSVNLNKSIDNVLNITRSKWKYQAKIKLDLDQNMPMVLVYASEINQALLNLIVNAAQSIAAKQKRDTLHEGQITISTKVHPGEIECRISDTGIGIPQEDQQRIFDPFFTTQLDERCTGQGLTVVHNCIVEMHGGSIEVESEVGRGATFILHIPIVVDDKPQESGVSSYTA
ncbi:MAG: sensor histidine kinase [Phycisphaeraceae bacterium JB051]